MGRARAAFSALVALLSAFLALSATSTGMAEEEIKLFPLPIAVKGDQLLSVCIEIRPTRKQCSALHRADQDDPTREDRRDSGS